MTPFPGTARPKFRARCGRSRVVAFKRNPKSRGSDVHAEMLDGVGFRSECQAADSRVNAIAPSECPFTPVSCVRTRHRIREIITPTLRGAEPAC
jgi:hypothetical protein